MQTKFAEIGGHRIRYLEDGRSERTLVLIHGLGGSSERWLEVIPRLSSKYRVIAPDIIGFGYSDKPSEDYTIEFFSGFLSSFIETLGLKSVTLVGTSLGGQIAAHYSADNPDVERLVLVAPSGAMKSSTAAVDAYIMAALYPNPVSAREAFGLMSRSGAVDDFTVSDFVKRMSLPNAKLAFISAVLGIKNSSIEQSLPRIRAPTLLVWGKQDRVIPIGFAAKYASSIKNCTFLPLDDCGHLPHVEMPETFSDAVLEFLQSRIALAKQQH
ncbi:MAG TPA: alpha/beta hydrolase [Candidatus Nitrosotalea sp.]|nr:alpha/beta hydrolase [Candidatus Nitrosotalea sp.]